MSDEEFENFGDDLGGVVPDKLVDDTYLCMLEEPRLITSKKDDRSYVLFDWEIIQEGPYYGETFSEIYRKATLAEYERADSKEQKDIRDARRKYRARLVSLGIPEHELDTTKPSVLNGVKAHVTVSVRPRTKGTGETIWVNNVEPYQTPDPDTVPF